MTIEQIVNEWQSDRNWSDDTVIKLLGWFCEEQDMGDKLSQFFRNIATSEDSEWCEGKPDGPTERDSMYLPPYFDGDEPPPF